MTVEVNFLKNELTLADNEQMKFLALFIYKNIVLIISTYTHDFEWHRKKSLELLFQEFEVAIRRSSSANPISWKLLIQILQLSKSIVSGCTICLECQFLRKLLSRLQVPSQFNSENFPKNAYFS